MPDAVKVLDLQRDGRCAIHAPRIKMATRRLPGSPSRSRARPRTLTSPAANHPAAPMLSGLSCMKGLSPQSRETNSSSGSGAPGSGYGLSGAGNSSGCEVARIGGALVPGGLSGFRDPGVAFGGADEGVEPADAMAQRPPLIRRQRPKDRPLRGRARTSSARYRARLGTS
jgi:hypothetical protein